jgi:hypothetical protein
MRQATESQGVGARRDFEARFGTAFAASFAVMEHAERQRDDPQVQARLDVDRALVGAALRDDDRAHAALSGVRPDSDLARAAVDLARVEHAEARHRATTLARPIEVDRDEAGHQWSRHARMLVKDALIEGYQTRGRFREAGQRGGEYPNVVETPRYQQLVRELADYMKRVDTSLGVQVSAGTLTGEEAAGQREAVMAATFRAPSDRVVEGFRNYAERALPRLREDVQRSMLDRAGERQGLQIEPSSQDREMDR